MIVLSKEEMREADYLTINKIGIPNEILMENAGKSCADFIVSKFSNDKKILVFCGTGNNGGDGFVISRWLTQKEFSVKIILIGNMNKMSKVTKLNYRLTKLLDITTLEYSNKESIVSEINTSDIIIDAIFGIGFYGKVAEPYLSIFREINLSSKTKIS